MVKVDLRELFIKRQQELLGNLDLTRSIIKHPGEKGDASELDWIGMLGKYTPDRYCVAKGFVIDHNGDGSEQQDVIIYDQQYSPPLLKESGRLLVPAESVYAVLEVKQDFSKAHIEYAGKKVASVRRLQRTSAPITHAGGQYSAREPFPILGGLLAFESSWAPPLGPSLQAALNGLSRDQRLDLGCALKDGAFEMIYPDSGEPILRQSQPETALIFFYLALIQRLQRLGTVPAIDWAEYGRVL